MDTTKLSLLSHAHIYLHERSTCCYILPTFPTIVSNSFQLFIFVTISTCKLRKLVPIICSKFVSVLVQHGFAFSGVFWYNPPKIRKLACNLKITKTKPPFWGSILVFQRVLPETIPPICWKRCGWKKFQNIFSQMVVNI